MILKEQNLLKPYKKILTNLYNLKISSNFENHFCITEDLIMVECRILTKRDETEKILNINLFTLIDNVEIDFRLSNSENEVTIKDYNNDNTNDWHLYIFYKNLNKKQLEVIYRAMKDVYDFLLSKEVQDAY